MQRESFWWTHILGEGPWLVTVAELSKDYSSCRSVMGFFPSEIPFYSLGPNQFIYTNHTGNATGSDQDHSRV